jgi:hypothetical protein
MFTKKETFLDGKKLTSFRKKLQLNFDYKIVCNIMECFLCEALKQQKLIVCYNIGESECK